MCFWISDTLYSLSGYIVYQMEITAGLLKCNKNRDNFLLKIKKQSTKLNTKNHITRFRNVCNEKYNEPQKSKNQPKSTMKNNQRHHKHSPYKYFILFKLCDTPTWAICYQCSLVGMFKISLQDTSKSSYIHQKWFSQNFKKKISFLICLSLLW